MPATLPIAMLVIGAVLLLIALLGGNFKIFGVEIADKLESKPLRFLAGLLAAVLITLAVSSPGVNPNDPPPSPGASSSPPIPSKQSSDNSQTPNQKAPSNSQTTSVDLSVNNVASEAGNGYWNWTIFLQGSADSLAQVNCVEYTLHPTFPQPVRTVCEPGNGEYPFGLPASGWGTFEVGVRIFLKNGQIREARHQLRFQ